MRCIANIRLAQIKVKKNWEHAFFSLNTIFSPPAPDRVNLCPPPRLAGFFLIGAPRQGRQGEDGEAEEGKEEEERQSAQGAESDADAGYRAG